MEKKHILRGRKLFKEVFSKGNYLRGRWFDTVTLAVANHDGKVAFATARRVRRAVDRNRIKRRMREAFRLEQPVVWTHMIVMIGHESILNLEFEKLRRELRQTLLKLQSCFPTS